MYAFSIIPVLYIKSNSVHHDSMFYESSVYGMFSTQVPLYAALFFFFFFWQSWLEGSIEENTFIIDIRMDPVAA